MPTAPSPAAGDAGLSRIGQIAITVHDLERATAFYRDALRLPFLFAAPGLAFFQCQGVRLMLSRPEKPEFDRPSAYIYFQVDDIEATHRTLTARGRTLRGSTPHRPPSPGP